MRRFDFLVKLTVVIIAVMALAIWALQLATYLELNFGKKITGLFFIWLFLVLLIVTFPKKK